MVINFKEKQNTDEEIYAILHPFVKEWFQNKFKTFATPQRFAVMDIHSRENILVSAPTGSGKTLTAFLSILNELVDSSDKEILQNKVYCIYISPLKALNNDVQKNLLEPLQEIEQIANKKLGIRVSVRTGDTTQKERSNMLKNPPHILITTPESLAILLSSEKFIEHLKQTDWCIIDEVHAIAENKRGVHLSLSLERLQELSPAMCRIGLSATVAPLENIANFLVGQERDCKIIDVQSIKNYDLKVLSPVPNLIDTPHFTLHQKMYELIDDLIQEHKTTLIFTNTRSATERVVDHLKTKFPKKYLGNIGAHHGSLGKEMRHSIEQQLREGKLKVVVSSTSLELGIDIGYIDLVICLGSPKSVARLLQRCGRAGHQLHATTKGRIIVMDRDDLIECAVMLKNAVEKRIDKIHIPENCLDVLAQQIFGMALQKIWEEKEVYELIKKSYCYRNLTKQDFNEILSYLAGEYADLEERHIYARIWRQEGKIGKRGKLSRVIYMTNIGTIPDESFITVKIGEQTIGKLDEAFLEKLKPGDVFVLGGDTYMFKFSRGMVAQVQATSNRPPTVPSWVSEMLPLSFDLAIDIGKFRRLMLEKLALKKSREEIIKFINEYLYVDENASNSIFDYFKEQYYYAKKIPNDKTILVEYYNDERDKKIVFHTLYGRRVNDCLSRAIAFIMSRKIKRDIELGISDNGFYISGDNKIDIKQIISMLNSEKLGLLMNHAIENSEVYKRRFRHCAGRALMILRNYMGRTKNVGRQQVSSMILMSALKRISTEFSILKEAKRECLSDLMDIENTKKVIQEIEKGSIRIEEINTSLPMPFSFNLAFQGHIDILKMEDKHEFLHRMHQMVLAKIGVSKEITKDFSYQEFWKDQQQKILAEKETKEFKLKQMAWSLEKVPMFVKDEIIKLIDGSKTIREDVIQEIKDHEKDIKKNWPKELQKFVFEKLEEVN